MFKLIWKDIVIQKRMVLIALAFFIFFVFSFHSLGPGGLTAGVLALSYIITFGASAIEDKYGVEILLNSFPIKRSMIVLSRYVAMFFYTAINLLASFLVYYIVKTLELHVEVVPFTVEGVMGSIIAVALLSSINFPIIFKYGYVKSRFVSIAFYFLFFFGGGNLVSYLKDHQWLEKWIVAGMSSNEIYLLLMVPTMVLMIISIFISLIIYKKREFS